jgi:hypothetical protein
VERGDLRAYAISLDHKASPLRTSWSSAGAPLEQVVLDGATSLPVVPDAGFGWVDEASVGLETEAQFELPPGVAAAEVAGLEMDVETSDEASIAVADGADHSGISFRVPAHRVGTVRLMLDNCPEWYGFTGRSLFLRYGKEFSVRAVRLLQR